MSYMITCPYCFKKMQDTEVMFRSERVSKEDPEAVLDPYDDIVTFKNRYNGSDKEARIREYEELEFFAPGKDEEYENFWEKFDGTTEYNPADKVLGVEAYLRKIIDPMNPAHQMYLRPQNGNDYFIRDGQNMVIQVELVTGEKCNRRVCRHCHNPLPDNYGKNTVKFATVIGITGAGKTVYLSQLLHRMRTYAVKAGLNAIVTHPSVRNFLENNAIVAGEPMPGSTPATQLQQPLFYEMVRDGGGNRKITETFVLYDVAGEVFKDASLMGRFAPFVEHADGAIVLIDPMQFEVISGVKNQGKKLDEPTTALDAIHGIFSRGNDAIKCKVPFAICISKADTQEVQSVFTDELSGKLLEDVQPIKNEAGFNLPLFNAEDYNPILNALYEFIQSNEMVLAQQMQTNYSSYAYFAFTALGCDVDQARGCPVGPVLPKRVEEPLLWLFHKLGYIGVNTPIDDPTRPKVPCPRCGNKYTDELPENDRIMIVGKIFKKKVPVNRVCSCGHRWLHG